jgi:hypothetical protein
VQHGQKRVDREARPVRGRSHITAASESTATAGGEGGHRVGLWEDGCTAIGKGKLLRPSSPEKFFLDTCAYGPPLDEV